MGKMSFDKKEWSYIFYDWAESCFTVIVSAFIFPMLYGILSRDLAAPRRCTASSSRR
jgi:MFS-type transporter involved in bile tolerance (Atg22 family)